MNYINIEPVHSISISPGTSSSRVKEIAKDILLGNSKYQLDSYNPESSAENKELHDVYNRVSTEGFSRDDLKDLGYQDYISLVRNAPDWKVARRYVPYESRQYIPRSKKRYDKFRKELATHMPNMEDVYSTYDLAKIGIQTGTALGMLSGLGVSPYIKLFGKNVLLNPFVFGAGLAAIKGIDFVTTDRDGDVTIRKRLNNFENILGTNIEWPKTDSARRDLLFDIVNTYYDSSGDPTVLKKKNDALFDVQTQLSSSQVLALLDSYRKRYMAGDIKLNQPIIPESADQVQTLLQNPNIPLYKKLGKSALFGIDQGIDFINSSHPLNLFSTYNRFDNWLEKVKNDR